MLKIGVVGAGNWGKNHIRALKDLSLIGQCNFVGISDYDPSKKSLAFQYGLKFFRDYKKLAKQVDAVIIAVPAENLYRVAKYFLRNGKHVLIEKPFTLKIKNGKELANLASQKKVTLMVGHIFLYTPQIEKIKEVVKEKTLGDIFYGYLHFLNLGVIRSDVNALWNFGPHAVSIFMHILESRPTKVWASGKAYLQDKVEDVVFLGMEFQNNALVESHLSWIDPIKTRKITLVGKKAMLVWDDTSVSESVKIYDKGVVFPENWENLKTSNSFGEFKLKVRFGDIVVPHIDTKEPLKNEQLHFIKSIKDKTVPLTDAKHALEVLRVLLTAQKSLDKDGRKINVKYD